MLKRTNRAEKLISSKLKNVLLVLLCSISIALRADNKVDSIYQYFASSGEANRPNLGAYLWIPPNTPKVRAVMVGMHNGLPINIMQSAPVRKVCREHGIAQVLFTPYAKDIEVMVKGLSYDISDPSRTAVYDGYMQRLADASNHPELLTAPVVGLGHSAYASFPFELAMRNPERCLAAIPIKAGLPSAYDYMKKHPDKGYSIKNVPILFVHSTSQETVKWDAYPQKYSTNMRNYRDGDTNDNPGTDYRPNADLFGSCWEMSAGHFDMLPRSYQFVADWLDAIASARLPARSESPLENLVLRDGWLMNPRIPATGPLPANYVKPAPYLDFSDYRKWALWFPNKDLAMRQFDRGWTEPRKKIEMFTFLDRQGKPISLAKGRGAELKDPHEMLHDDGRFTLTTHHFTEPFLIETSAGTYENVVFPGKTELPVSTIPLDFDAHGGALKLISSDTFKDDRGVTETRHHLKLVCHRMSPSIGYNMNFVRVFHEGDEGFAAAGRTCQMSMIPDYASVIKNAPAQTVNFPAIPDTNINAGTIQLKATSSAGLPVEYFVLKGPGIIENNAFVIKEIPAGMTKPIEVTIGAYQVGLFKKEGGVKPAKTVYQTFNLIRKADNEPVAAADSYTMEQGQTLTVAAADGVLANDHDMDNDPLTSALVTDVNVGTLDFNSDGSFFFQPPADFVGEATFTYLAIDSLESSSTVTVRITVNGVDTDNDEGNVYGAPSTTNVNDTVVTVDELAWCVDGWQRLKGGLAIDVIDNNGTNQFVASYNGAETSVVSGGGLQMEIAAYPKRILRPFLADDYLGLRFKSNMVKKVYQSGDSLADLYNQSATGCVLEKDGAPQNGLKPGSNWLFFTGFSSSSYSEYSQTGKPVTTIAVELIWRDNGTAGAVDPGDRFEFGNLRYAVGNAAMDSWSAEGQMDPPIDNPGNDPDKMAPATAAGDNVVVTADQMAWYTGGMRFKDELTLNVVDNNGSNQFVAAYTGPETNVVGASGLQMEIAAYPKRILRPFLADDYRGLIFKSNLVPKVYQYGDSLGDLYNLSPGLTALEKDGVPQNGLKPGSNWLFFTGLNSTSYSEYSQTGKPVTTVAVELIWRDNGAPGIVDPGDRFEFGSLRYAIGGTQFTEWR